MPQFKIILCYTGAGAKSSSILTVGIPTAVLSGAIMFCVGVLVVTACSWRKRKHHNNTSDKNINLGENKERGNEACIFSNVASIPTSNNAAYIRGNSLCSSTNTSDLLMNPLICDKQQIQSSEIHQMKEAVYSTTTDGYESIPLNYEDPVPYQIQADPQCQAMSSTTSARDRLRSSTPTAVSTGDSQTNIDERTDICSETDTSVECTAQTSNEKILSVSPSAQNPACCTRDTKQPDHPAVIQTADSTLPSEQSGDPEVDAEDYEIAGQVYEHFSERSGYERMGSVYESSQQHGYESLGSIYEYTNTSGSYETEGSIHGHVTIQAHNLSVE